MCEVSRRLQQAPLTADCQEEDREERCGVRVSRLEEKDSGNWR